MQNKKWIPWSVGEGVASASASLISKSVGLHFVSWHDGFLASVVLGVFQTVGAVGISLVRRTDIFLSRTFVLLCSGLGVALGLQNVLIYIAISQGADLGVYAFFVIGVGIVPATLLDMFFFGTRLSRWGWSGVALVVFGGYAMLGFPSLAALAQLPSWFFLALIAMVLFGCNRVFSRGLSQIHVVADAATRAVAQSVWVGIASTLIAAVASLPFGGIIFHTESSGFYLGLASVGLLIVAMLGARLVAFSLGVNSPLSVTVSVGTTLAVIALGGILIYGEAFAIGKVIGIALYPIAYYLLQRDTAKKV